MTWSKNDIETAYQNHGRSDKAAYSLGMSPTHFKRLMHRYELPFLHRWEQPGRWKPWSPIRSRALAYVLGVLLGDGHVSGPKPNANGYKVKVSVTDRVFAEKVYSALKEIGLRPHPIALHRDKRPNRSLAYVAETSSRIFSDWYLGLSMTDIETWIREYEDAFLCGLWESEGHARPEGSCFDAIIGMTREDVIDLIVKIAKNWGLHPKKYGPYHDRRGVKPIYRACLFRNTEVYSFIHRLKPCIKASPRQSRAKQAVQIRTTGRA